MQFRCLNCEAVIEFNDPMVILDPPLPGNVGEQFGWCGCDKVSWKAVRDDLPVHVRIEGGDLHLEQASVRRL